MSGSRSDDDPLPLGYQAWFSVCQVETDAGTATYLAALAPEIARARGMEHDAIIGELTEAPDGSWTNVQDTFVPNARFVHLLHEVIARAGPADPGFQAEARRVERGHVFVIDRRTPTPEGAVPPDDLIGYFQVLNGVVVPDSYTPNPSHKLLNRRGLFQLAPALHAALMEHFSR